MADLDSSSHAFANTHAPRSRRERGRREAAPRQATQLASVAPVGGLSEVLTIGHGFNQSWKDGTGQFLLNELMDAATIDEFAERIAKRLAVEVDATVEQQDKILGIASSALKDLLSLGKQLEAGRTQGLQVFKQPIIDRAAIAKLSGEQMVRAEEASRRLVKALHDATEVLTPEQRATLLAARTKPALVRHQRSRNG
jgi:Spy/CpxP family protein refolding chaperone